MIKIIIFNVTKQVVLAKEVRVARTFYERLLGWMGRPAVGEEEALVLLPCQAIHTCFLKFPLDVLFVAADGQVLFTLANLHPFRFSPLIRRSRLVVELPAGRLKQTNTRTGDRLVFDDREEPYA
ncbi:Protein of unknown function DUF192 [Moorella glycerini]|uniref:ACR n=2 Tax=Neomoorella TaxID=44260 RepID=A0A9X7P649_9FIRM|nr:MULTISPECIES: DUF192 domain-containing protein [Moorella]KYH32962.1 hypothetical protein MOMUL_07400 [Moorella mulderi DSM 14980]PRR72781.1 hypothetical protein MOST_16750 [Moorella stamsii]CEP66282.1 Protein of unknown function DUF192 [Moorella glycerini]CEP68126.1 Protein of unknown function DUF192 [Moorella glycerini]